VFQKDKGYKTQSPPRHPSLFTSDCNQFLLWLSRSILVLPFIFVLFKKKKTHTNDILLFTLLFLPLCLNFCILEIFKSPQNLQKRCNKSPCVGHQASTTTNLICSSYYIQNIISYQYTETCACLLKVSMYSMF
jgi:hypothetical protein